MTTKSRFTQQFSNNLAKSALVENNYFIGIAQTDPWPNEVDEISPNPDLPEPYLPEIGLQNLVGIVRVKALQLLSPLEKLVYIKSADYSTSIPLPNSQIYNRAFTTLDSVWLYSTRDQLFAPIFQGTLLLDRSKSLVSSVGKPNSVATDLIGYIYGLSGSEVDNTLRITKYTTVAKDFKSQLLPNFNEVQKIENIGAVAGQFFISFNGSNTIPISYNITPTTLNPLLEALPGIGVGNVICTSQNGVNLPLTSSPILIEFTGILSNQSQPLLQTQGINLTGNTPMIKVSRVRTGLSNSILDINSDGSYLTCLNSDGFLIPFNNQTLQRANVYSELDLRDLLGLTSPTEFPKLHYHISDEYLLVLSNLNTVFILDKFTYTVLARFAIDVPVSDPSEVLSITILGSNLYVLTQNNLHIFNLDYEMENFVIFEYGNSKFVGINKNDISIGSFKPTYLGWYAEILPNQLPNTVFRQTALINNVKFKPNTNTSKSVFLASEIDYYEVVFISNHEPQIINSDTYKLLKVVRSF